MNSKKPVFNKIIYFILFYKKVGNSLVRYNCGHRPRGPRGAPRRRASQMASFRRGFEKLKESPPNNYEGVWNPLRSTSRSMSNTK